MPTAWRMAWSSIIQKRDNDFFPVAAVCDHRRNFWHTVGADRAPLQFCHRVANIVDCYVLGDVSISDAWRDDEADFSGFKFLVEV
jgi:hypothetical protein